MRLASVRHLTSEAKRSFLRFPFVVLAAFVAAVCGVIALDRSDNDTFVKGVAAAQLGIPLFFALAVAGEKFRWAKALRGALAAACAVVLVAYYLSLPDWFTPGAATRHVQFNVGLHLLVAFVPFVAPGWLNGFWQYNKALFLRFILAAVYSFVIFTGLSVALTALDKLLGVHLPRESYAWLMVIVSFLFNTWVFVGGIPEDIEGLEQKSDYPRGLKVFSQYILMPLVTVYLTILTIYLFKVVITKQWPSGWIGYLVSSVATVGILALLLVYPISMRSENKWVATFTRWFYIFMIPSIVMLLMSIYKRVHQYGITENRYFLMILAAWLAGIAVYFIFSRQKSIKVIPVTLCVVAFATSFGPWGAYGVSQRSQVHRLERILVRDGILVDGAIQAVHEHVPLDDEREISAILHYIVENHGTAPVRAWFGAERLAKADSLAEPKTVLARRHTADRVRALTVAMGVDYVEGWGRTESGFFNYSLDSADRVASLDGADYFIRLDAFGGTPKAVAFADSAYTLSWDRATARIRLERQGDLLVELPVDSIPVYIEAAGAQFNPSRTMPQRLMTLSAEANGTRLVAYFLNVSGQKKAGRCDIQNFSANCFVTLRRE